MAKKLHKAYNADDARALRNSSIPSAIMASEGTRFDSAEDASVFFARELDYVKAKSYDVVYPEFTAINTLPISSEADAGAETVTYYTYDKQGVAKIIDNYSTDLPRADVIGKPNTANVQSVGASYGYSAQEMRASRMAGKSLDTRKAEAAHYQVDNAINKIAFKGDANYGLVGLLTTGNGISRYTIPSGVGGSKYWASKTAAEILKDINGMAAYVARITKNVERPDTLMIPSDVYMDIATRQVDHINATVLSFVLEHAPYIKNIIPAAELNADSVDTNPFASLTANSGRGCAFLFKNSPEKLTLENPMPFYQYPIQVRNLETIVPVEARTAGVIIYYPLSAVIAQDVSSN